MRHTKRRPSCSPLLRFLLLLVIFSKISTTKCDDHDDGDQGTSLIEEACKTTPHYELCVSSLESKPESREARDVRALAAVMAEIVLSTAAETLEAIRELLKKQEPPADKSLAFCAELYIPVVKYTLPQAIDALSGGHFGFANYGLSDAAKQANACEKTIAASSSPISDRNALLADLSQVAAALVSSLT